MTIHDNIGIDPGAFRIVLQTAMGTAWWCPTMKRYVVEVVKPMPAAGDDTVATREVWTNDLKVVHELIGGPVPGEQLDIFKEALAWGT